MLAAIRREHDAIRGVAAKVIGDCCAVIGQDQANLLIFACLQLLCRAQGGEEALIVGLSEEIDLLRLRGEAGSQVGPTTVVVAGARTVFACTSVMVT